MGLTVALLFTGSARVARISVCRSFEVWAESDLHDIPHQSRHLVFLVNAGPGWHF
jgi:hypothetical protein